MLFAKPEHEDAASTLSKDDVAKIGSITLTLQQKGDKKPKPASELASKQPAASKQEPEASCQASNAGS